MSEDNEKGGQGTLPLEDLHHQENAKVEINLGNNATIHPSFHCYFLHVSHLHPQPFPLPSVAFFCFYFSWQCQLQYAVQAQEEESTPLVAFNDKEVKNDDERIEIETRPRTRSIRWFSSFTLSITLQFWHIANFVRLISHQFSDLEGASVLSLQVVPSWSKTRIDWVSPKHQNKLKQ